MTEDAAAKQAVERLVEALVKISATMTVISKAQTVIVELLKDIHAEQLQQRHARVRLAAMIEGRGDRNYRPN